MSWVAAVGPFPPRPIWVAATVFGLGSAWFQVWRRRKK